MNSCIPPRPPQGKDPAMIARLVRFRDSMDGSNPAEERERESRVLLIAACVLSLVGTALLVCALLVECFPDLGIAQTAQEMWNALF